jgi:8-oxo-dGTP pyrophosphatase MutT (NUDIX family)
VGSSEPDEPREDLSLIVPFAGLHERLAARPRATAHVPGHHRAAVLVPLLVRAGAACTVLTLRSSALRAHSGQWSFPGGRIDDGDEHATATALREAEEEIGIDPARVEILGLLGNVTTGTGYTITPVVARIAPPTVYRLNPAEVAEVLEVPLARLGPPQVRGEVERAGQRVQILAFDVDGRDVWGATARILAELLAVLAT